MANSLPPSSPSSTFCDSQSVGKTAPRSSHHPLTPQHMGEVPPQLEEAITALPAALMSNNKAVPQVQVNGPFPAPSDFPEEDPAVAKELVVGDGLKLNLVSVGQHPCFEVKQDKGDAGFPYRPGHRIDISSAQHNRKVVSNYFSNPYLVSALFVA